MGTVIKFFKNRFGVRSDVKKLERTKIGSTQNSVIPIENED